jgi:hypothetical protein
MGIDQGFKNCLHPKNCSPLVLLKIRKPGLFLVQILIFEILEKKKKQVGFLN